ncbi:MAG: PQQ-dependent sugar dehydrogenase [Myxococcota bacterium]
MRALALLPLLAACAGGKDGPVDPVRPTNATCLAPERPETGAGVSVERVWPALAFEQPVSLLQAPGDTSRWFVVEQTGRVMVFDAAGDTAAADVFLDLTDAVEAGYSETGLLGVAFHPDFADNGEVYVSYTRPGPLTSVLARFVSHDGGVTLDPASEEVLLTVRQPYSNHNGGHVAFGPDGSLYLALGDGGSAGDPEGNGQDTGTLLGKMLRIDVDGAAPYGIPADNPFADGAGGLPEIYAWGLRNTWKFSFDAASGVLWAGDVGQDRREEIDIVENGGNYGWNLKEGTNCYEAPSPCDGGGLVDPVAEYTHAEGECVTGGFVYRGTEMPGYEGVYFYADYVSGTVWALLFDEVTRRYRADLTQPESSDCTGRILAGLWPRWGW